MNVELTPQNAPIHEGAGGAMGSEWERPRQVHAELHLRPRWSPSGPGHSHGARLTWGERSEWSLGRAIKQEEGALSSQSTPPRYC